MTIKVILASEAEQQIRRIDTWWKENRPHSPEAFIVELSAAFTLLADAPRSGQRFFPASLPNVRRLFLKKSRHFIYYVEDSQRGMVVVLSVWSPQRASTPDL